MLIFSPLGGSATRCKGGQRGISAFAEKAEAGDLLMMATPEETPTEGTISWPGEYDVAGIAIRGVGQKEGQQVSYLATVDGTRCAFIAGPLMEWTDAELESLGDVDVLVIPAEDGKKVQTLVEEIDPRVLILVPDAKGKFDPDTMKACGAQGKEHVTEHKLKGMPAEGREVVVLEK